MKIGKRLCLVLLLPRRAATDMELENPVQLEFSSALLLYLPNTDPLEEELRRPSATTVRNYVLCRSIVMEHESSYNGDTTGVIFE